MGEENKEEKWEEETKEESREEEKKLDDKTKEEDQAAPPSEIVLKVNMHCEACTRKIARALKGFEGVEEVRADSESGRVVVKGKAVDPEKVCERLHKKSGRKVELISPIFKLPRETNVKDEEDKKQPREEKQKEPQLTVVLSVRMHCEACAQVLQRQVRKIKGIESVEADLSNDRVIVKGVVGPQALVDYVKKRTGKHASVVKDDDEEKEGEEEKKDDYEKEGSGDDNNERHQEKEGEDDDNNKPDIKWSEYWPSKYYMEFAYAPQMFSDENPSACSVM